ncbi:MAG TPA: glycosyltransferase [Candidatus Krumholzibacteria bacterium]|nr:glycosyltransferase [Candidatus Krumholzibacteria bacterium]
MARRILIVSEDLVQPWDEGIKKFAYSIGTALAPDHPVRMINVDRSGGAASRGGTHAREAGAAPIVDVSGSRTFATPALRREVSSFQPEGIVYVPSPSSTAGSFARSYVLRRHWPRAKLGMVALIPRRHGKAARAFLQGAAPDVLFVPSYASLLHASDLSLRAELLPVGVDVATFRPARDGERSAFRRARGIPEDAFVFLHVGHLSEKRNLRSLATLAGIPGAHVVVVGSTSTPEDAALRRDLEAAGVRVIREVVPVDEFYRLADAYVFPTIDSEGCVEIPLSVMEALASGLPVLARPFGGLRDVLAPGEDVRYFESDDEIRAAAARLMGRPRPVARSMGAFAWRAIAERIVTRLCDPPGARAS